MSVGAQLSVRKQSLQAWLARACTGQTRFRTTGWKQFRWKFWALDCINHGQQPQRVANRRTFARRSNVIALYPVPPNE
jgi:hypothetical protein